MEDGTSQEIAPYFKSQHFSVVADKRPIRPTLRQVSAAQELCLGPNGEENSQVQLSTPAEDFAIQDIASGHESQYSDDDYEMDEKKPLLITPEPAVNVCWTEGIGDTPRQDIACVSKPKRLKLASDCAVLEDYYEMNEEKPLLSTLEPNAAVLEDFTSQDISSFPKREKTNHDCAVFECDYNRKLPYFKPGIKYRTFPKKKSLCAEWLEFCQNPRLKDKAYSTLIRRYFICSQHFDESDFIVTKKGAVCPTLRPSASQGFASIIAENVPSLDVTASTKRLKTSYDCSVLECDYNRKEPYHKTGILCHPFPTNKSWCAEWLEFCQDPHLKEKSHLTLQKSYFICSQHFAKHNYEVVEKRKSLIPCLLGPTSEDISPGRVKKTSDCAVLTCDYNKKKYYYKSNIKHHSFPIDISRCNKWIEFCKNAKLKGKTRNMLRSKYFICSQHFSVYQERTPLRPTLRPIPAAGRLCLGQNGRQTRPSTSVEYIPTRDNASNIKRVKTKYDCAVLECDYNLKKPYNKPGIQCHFFPSDQFLFAEWIEFCQNPHLKEKDPLVLQENYFICSQHFAESDYELVVKKSAPYPTIMPSLPNPIGNQIQASTSSDINPVIVPKRVKTTTSDCAVLACDYHSNKPYHRSGIKRNCFPIEMSRFEKWIKFCKNPHLKDKTPMQLQKSYFICSQHFLVVTEKRAIRPSLRSIPAAEIVPSQYITSDSESVKTCTDCSVLECDYNRTEPYHRTGIKKHYFPKDEALSAEWREFCREPRFVGKTAIELSKTYFICSQHFAESDFEIVGWKRNTIPTLMPHQPSTSVDISSSFDSNRVKMTADCAVLGCDYNRNRPYRITGIKCHIFPKDKFRRTKWIEFCLKRQFLSTPIDFSKSYFICSQHFAVVPEWKPLRPSLRTIPAAQGQCLGQNIKESSQVQHCSTL